MEAIPLPIAPYRISFEGKHFEIIDRRTPSVIRQIESGCRNLLSRFNCDPGRIIRAVESEGSNNNNSKSNALADFLAENGDLTIDDIIAAFRRE